ncbi:hypothetical protein NUW58_g10756 [Xylaria curta]|uniref:Uncharacterized protein n=1 Tax=Xylaria curta TaxID=42375 RepID=A0ACC1MHQ5_9PEZI|nr:hypothetical protein NUW58_g10756 [Xylaria curta]
MRLVRDGGADSDDEGSYSERSGGYWSGSGSERDGESETDKGGSRLGSPKESRKRSVRDLRERQEDRGENDPTGKEKEKEKGKGLSGSAFNSGTSTLGGSTPSNASLPASSATNLTTSTSAAVSLNETVMESLTEALATDMHVGSAPTEQNAV